MIGLTINGMDARDLGLRLLSRGPVYARPGLSRSTVGIPGKYGGALGRLALGEPKVIPVTWQIRSSASSRRTDMDAVLAWCDGLMEIVWEDATDRVTWGIMDVLGGADRFEAALAEGIGNLEVEAEILNPFGVSFATEPTILALPADTPVELPVGTATSAPVVYFGENITDPTLTYRGGNGLVLSRLSLDGEVPTDSTLQIDCGTETLVLFDDTDADDPGTPAPEFFDHTLTGGIPNSGGYPIIDPGDARGGAGPTLEASDAAVCVYRRTFE